MYRPQFAYATPLGCRDEDFTYHFDGSNTPLLNQNISGKTIDNIPLVLEQDAPFYWRAWKVTMRENQRITESTPLVQYVAPNFYVRLRDCYQNDLQDTWVPASECGFPQNPLTINSSMLTGPPVPLEPEIYCPRGGVILAFLQAPLLVTPPVSPGDFDNFLVSFTLYGVKRFKECNS